MHDETVPRGELNAAELAVDQVTKYFGDNKVLDDVSVHVNPGETVAVIGGSGSGKSTLLRVMAGLEPAENGRVVLGGSDLVSFHDGKRKLGDDYRRRRLQMGFVFQHFTLFPQLTVLENVMLGPHKVLGYGKEKARAEAVRVIERVGLSDRLTAYPAHMSGGQKQRAAIARELAMGRKAILFDEVTSALDPELVHEVLEVMQALARQGLTMVVVTHEMGFAKRVAKQIVYMNKGVIVESGPPEKVLEDPQSPRTQQFLSAIVSY